MSIYTSLNKTGYRIRLTHTMDPGMLHIMKCSPTPPGRMRLRKKGRDSDPFLTALPGEILIYPCSLNSPASWNILTYSLKICSLYLNPDKSKGAPSLMYPVQNRIMSPAPAQNQNMSPAPVQIWMKWLSPAPVQNRMK